MKIFPAIDLKNGRCVRLLKGDFNQVTEYNSDPIEQAIIFKSKNLIIFILLIWMVQRQANNLIKKLLKKS